MPSLVPKFAFLVVDIGLRKPPNLSIFSEIGTFHKVIEHMFWFDSERFWYVKQYSKGFFKQCSHFGTEIRIF
mgnify:CR=1 FL=1